MRAILTEIEWAGQGDKYDVIARTTNGFRVQLPKDDSQSNPQLYAAVMLVRKKKWAPIILAGGELRGTERVFVMLKPTPSLITAVNEAARLGHGADQTFHYVGA